MVATVWTSCYVGFHGNQFRLNFVFTTDKLERQIPGEPSFSSVKINVTNVHMAEASIFVLALSLSVCVDHTEVLQYVF